MAPSGLLIVPLFLAVAAALSLLMSWRERAKLQSRLRAEWGDTRDRLRPTDMEAVAELFRDREGGRWLDDRTWNDLLMDDVFAHLDRTESSIGQQMLYLRLRSAPQPRALGAFDALVARVSEDATRRERAQTVLARLGSTSVYYLHRLAWPGAIVRQPWHVAFPLWTVTVLLLLALGLHWPVLLFVGVMSVFANRLILFATARRVGGEVVWFRQVGPLLSAARELAPIGSTETAPITGSLDSDLVSLRRLGGIARWVSRDAATSDTLSMVFLELINMVFLLDLNALYFAGGELVRQAPTLLRVLESVGEIDAAIAVASFRAGTEGWIRPRFLESQGSASFARLRHPLVDDAVPNSIDLAPPRGVLITGSNMSGKSTFLRTVGVNVVLAQTINTCLAHAYEAPVYTIRSCIGRADDLMAGKSYYLVEVESVLALVKASESPEPHLFILDEMFRGTNAVERIAAAEAVLHALLSTGKPHVVLTATHDAELVDLLRESYVVCHLGDQVGPDGLVFDYQLKPGPATSRNAITLLKLHGAPDSLVRRALDRAAVLDKQRQAT